VLPRARNVFAGDLSSSLLQLARDCGQGF
jgi:hypothetical protein